MQTVLPNELNQMLDLMRKKGDSAADQLISRFFETEKGKKDLMQWLMGLKTNQDLESVSHSLDENSMKEIKEMIQIPSWADESRLALARNFFTRNSPWIMNLLGLLSLPFCYAAADGARVLCFTERLTKDPEDRLKETAEFIWQMMDPETFSPQAKGLVSILKVRLIHAAIRFYIGKDANWKEEWGIPVNQEDMAGTNLAFSLVVLRGLRKMGIWVREDEQEAFLHLWNVVGHILGLEPELIPTEVQKTIQLEKAIRNRHFKPSQHGLELTKKLMDYFHTIPKDPKKPTIILENWMVDLLTEPIAGMLGIYRSSAKGLPLKWVAYLNQLGLLDWENKKATYKSRYHAYLNQNTTTSSASLNWKDYSLFPIPISLN